MSLQLGVMYLVPDSALLKHLGYKGIAAFAIQICIE